MAVQKRNDELVDLLACDFVLNNGELHLSHADVAATPYSAAKGTVVLVTTGAGDVVVNLPVASGVAGKVYSIKKVDVGAGGVTITPNLGAGDLIDGAASYKLTAQWEAVIIVCDGGDWYILSEFTP